LSGKWCTIRNYGIILVHLFKSKVWFEGFDDLMGHGNCCWNQKVFFEITVSGGIWEGFKERNRRRISSTVEKTKSYVLNTSEKIQGIKFK
jgi:hypothetical protein